MTYVLRQFDNLKRNVARRYAKVRLRVRLNSFKLRRWMSSNKIATFLLGLLCFFLLFGDVVFDHLKMRSVVVEAKTLGLQIEFQEAATLPIGDATICRPRLSDDPDLLASSEVIDGCALAFSTRLPLLQFSLVFPPGSKAELRLSGDLVELEVLRTGLENAPQAKGVKPGDVVLFPADQLRNLPQFTAFGAMQLGAPPVSGAKGALISGSYSFRYAPLVLRWLDSNRMLLSSEPELLYPGAQFRVVREDGLFAPPQNAAMNMWISQDLAADGTTDALHVVGISEFGRVKANVEYVGTEAAYDWPHWTMIVRNDPLVLLLVTLGAIGALRNPRKLRRK